MVWVRNHYFVVFSTVSVSGLLCEGIHTVFLDITACGQEVHNDADKQ